MEKIRNFLTTIYLYLKIALVSIVLIVVIWLIVSPTTLYNALPSFSWWSATFLSDSKTRSIVTEVEASGYNIRKVQSIDVFGRVCTDTYSSAGTSTDCDYPPVERMNWTIENYKVLLKK